METTRKRAKISIALLYLMTLFLILAGCGSGGDGASSSSGGSPGISTEVVSGVASVGAPLAGQVTLKDSSNPAREKTTVIGSDGSFALDVTGMNGPFILEATGSANGVNYTLHSFASGPGTANVNPLANAAVANAAAVDDPAEVYGNPHPETLGRIRSGLRQAIIDLLTKLKPLLAPYGADKEDPIGDHYKTDHTGLDGLFDDVRITLAQGILTITNAKTGAVIFTASVKDILAGNLDPGTMPNPGSVPSTPAGISAAGGAGQVTVSWSAVGNATSYNLYWATTSGVTTANGAKIAGAANPYVHTGLAAGTTCYYIVTAVNGAGESPASSQASATTNSAPAPPALPAAPAGVSAAGGSNQATVSWSAVSGATSYNIYWSAASGVTTANGTKIAGAVSPAVKTALTAGTTYYFIVTAVNGAGEGTASVQVAAATLPPVPPPPTLPAAPTGVGAAGGANQATVSWTAVSGATSYNLYWSATSGVTKTTGTRIAGVTSPYVHTGLSAGANYYYIVTAVNGAGESSASAQASATTNAPPPAILPAPTGAAASGGAKQITVSWTAVSGATSYNLYWSAASGVTTATGTKISGAATPYVQTGLADSAARFFIVTAVNAAGESPASAQVTATTNAPLPTPPNAPTGMTATGGAKQVTVSWSAVSGATSYNLYWALASGVTTGTGTRISGAASPYIHTGLADSTAYYYIVTAVNGAGEGVASTQASATTAAAAIDGAALYTQDCAGCHGALASSRKRAATAGQIQTGITNNSGGMGSLSGLSSAQIQAIAAALNF